MRNLIKISSSIILITSLFSGSLFAQRGIQNNDSIISYRLFNINSEIPIPYNNILLSFINKRVHQSPQKLQNDIAKFRHYESYLETEIALRDLPMELKYLPFAISNMDMRMNTSSGIAGAWGLNVPTAIKAGLHITNRIDERFDFYKATPVALDHLKSMYERYDNWMKAIVAYCNSPAGLHAAMIRFKENKVSVWDIYFYSNLPNLEVIPEYIFSVYIFNYLSTYELKIPKYKTTEYESTILKDAVLFNQLIEKTEISENTFFELNPVFVGKRLIADSNTSINLPISAIEKFSTWEDSLYASAKLSIILDADSVASGEEVLFAEGNTPTTNTNTTTNTANRTNTRTQRNTNPVTYTVKSGDNLGRIAINYKVSVSELKRWNNLPNDNIYIGQKLKIYSKGYVPKNTNTTNNTQRSTTNKEEYIYYTVKKGDSLWKIASKYDGVTDADIRKLNNIGNDIYPGQVLKIKRK